MSKDVISYKDPYPEWFIDKSRDPTISQIDQQIWLLTGTTIYQGDCALHLALYKWHLKNSLMAVSAGELSKLLKDYSDHPELVRYLTTLLELVNSSSNPPEVEVFNSLSQAEQQSVYLTIAKSQQHDKLACTSTVLQMMRRYPSSMAQHAISTARVLIQHEKQEGSKIGTLNPLRKMLILELMPLILSKGTEFLDTLTETVVILFIQLTAHYYIECTNVTDPAIKEEFQISDPWKDLKEILVKFARLHNWHTVPDFLSPNAPDILKSLEDEISTKSDVSHPGRFYCILFLLFESAFKYIRLIDSASVILIKDSDSSRTVEMLDEEPVNKRRRTLSLSESGSQMLTYFKIAELCHRCLIENSETQFISVCKEIKMNSFRWYSLFINDLTFYNSEPKFNDFQKNHCKEFPNDSLRMLAQQALGNAETPSNTFKCIWNLLDSMPPESENAHHSPNITICHHETKNNFIFVPNTRSTICLHICRALVELVKEKAAKTKQSDVLALLLLIYQYDIDTFQDELNITIQTVKSSKTFKYKGFLNLVSDIVLLEELLFLATHTEVRLDILPEIKKRYNKEEVVSLIKEHVHHCKSNSQDDVIRFITDNRDVIETKFGQFVSPSS